MGNVTVSTNGADMLEEDEKWLKMPASDLFDLEVWFHIYLRSRLS
jgi:hypothetical protein